MKDELYIKGFIGSVRELVRIGLRNKWLSKKDLIRLIESETEK